jgi:hypothetical protein
MKIGRLFKELRNAVRAAAVVDQRPVTVIGVCKSTARFRPI